MNLSRIEERQCLLHAKRLIDGFFAGDTGWGVVVAQCSTYVGCGLHCWLERGDKVYDLTRRKKPFNKDYYYAKVGVVNFQPYTPLEILQLFIKPEWDNYWRSQDEEVDGSMLYDLDAITWERNGWPDDPPRCE